MMKRFFQILPLLALLLLMEGMHDVLAQVPARISFQSLTLDEAGTPLDDGSYEVTFRLYTEESGGQALWSETQTVAVTDGLLSTLIGAKEALDLPFDKPYYLSVELDGEEETERVPLSSAAYSLLARDVADGAVVRSIGGLKDDVELVGGPGIAVRQEGNKLIIAAANQKGIQGFGPDETLHREAEALQKKEALLQKLGKPTTDAEEIALLDELAATFGPGGSNAGLDAAYDASSVITLDAGQVLLAGVTPGVGFQVRDSDMLFRTINGSASAFRFLVDAPGSTPQGWKLELTGGLGGSSGQLRFTNTTSGRVPLLISKTATNNLMQLEGSTLTLRNAAGTPKITLNTDENGDGRVITQELEITGGSDLSENFDVTGRFGIEAPMPGMVVSIDPEHPGQLALSGMPYDRMVAGVVSGAGGIETGLLMGQKGSEADGAYPVALTGRVYVWVDASYGAITPGDLLTSSATPGHAMKVGDYTQAQGAILGKAMTALPEGQGLVLMLVTLQ